MEGRLSQGDLGLVLRGQDRWAEAAESLRTAVALDPKNADAKAALVDVETATALAQRGLSFRAV